MVANVIFDNVVHCIMLTIDTFKWIAILLIYGLIIKILAFIFCCVLYIVCRLAWMACKIIRMCAIELLSFHRLFWDRDEIEDWVVKDTEDDKEKKVV